MRAVTGARADVRNIALLLVGFGIIATIISPARPYPVLDDWAYAQSVGRLLDLSYVPHDQTQPSSIGHLIWGALFTLLSGADFAALTLATLTMSAACLVLFYLLLRHCDIAAPPALLGAALIGFNPVYFFLSFSFMTDVTFVAYLVAACLCYVRGLRVDSVRWMLAGGIFAALCFLTRQIGLVIVPGVLLYLWWSRTLSLKRVAASVSLPFVAAALYLAWEQQFPTQLIAHGMEATIESAFSGPYRYVAGRLQTTAVVLTALGLYLAPVIRFPRRLYLTVPVFGVLAFLLFRTYARQGTVFPVSGNVVNHTGYNLSGFNGLPLWPELVWGMLAILGAVLVSLFAASTWERLVAWVGSGRWKARSEQTVLLPYFMGLLLGVGTFLLSPYLFDRYLLALLPFLVLFALRGLALSNRSASNQIIARRALVLAPLATFALFAQLDYKARATARWTAAEQLVSAGVPLSQVDGGFEWNGWHLYQEGAQIVRAGGAAARLDYPPHAVLDPVYVVSGVPRDGYEIAGSVPYHSILSGFERREAYILKRR